MLLLLPPLFSKTPRQGNYPILTNFKSSTFPSPLFVDAVRRTGWWFAILGIAALLVGETVFAYVADVKDPVLYKRVWKQSCFRLRTYQSNAKAFPIERPAF